MVHGMWGPELKSVKDLLIIPFSLTTLSSLINLNPFSLSPSNNFTCLLFILYENGASCALCYLAMIHVGCIANHCFPIGDTFGHLNCLAITLLKYLHSQISYYALR